MGGTTASGFVIGRGTVSDLSQTQATKACCCCGWGPVGKAAALSKRGVMSTALDVHSPRVEKAARASAPHRHGRLPAQRLMRPAGVVEGDPRADAGPRLTAIRIALEIDFLVLERAPQPLNEHVVHPTPAPVHRDLDPGPPQRVREGRARELRALVGVEDLRPPEPGKRLLQGIDAEARVQGV